MSDADYHAGGDISGHNVTGGVWSIGSVKFSALLTPQSVVIMFRQRYYSLSFLPDPCLESLNFENDSAGHDDINYNYWAGT